MDVAIEPQAPTRSEFKRGWTIIIAAMVGVGFGTTGLPFYTLGLFIKPLTHVFGWSRGGVAGAGLLLHAGAIVAGPFAGRLIDRFGARKVGIPALVGLGLGFAGLTLINSNILSYYGAWAALSLLGCATSPIVWTSAINTWFSRNRGLALGCCLMGTGLSAVLGPMSIGAVIAAWGWKAGYMTLSAATLLGALPVVSLLLRDSPDPSVKIDKSSLWGASAAQALRSRRFWICGLAFVLISTTVAGVIVNLPALLIDRGYKPTQAAAMASTLGLAVIFGRIVFGRLVDYFHAPYVGGAFLLLAAVACLVLRGGPPLPAILALGLAAGAEIDLLAYLTSRYYGLKAYGTIYGLQLIFFSIGAGLGPLLLGASQDRLKSYQPGLLVCAASVALGAVLIASLGPFADTPAKAKT